MATKKRVQVQEPTDQELELMARELVRRASGLSGTEFKKELDVEHRKFDKRVLFAADQLAARGELYRWSAARKVRFYDRDPLEALPRVMLEVLEEGPLTESALITRVESKARGLGDLAKSWLKQALASGQIHPHPPLPGSKSKRFGKEPDLPKLLNKVLGELKKVLASPAAKRIPKERLLEVIAREMGVTTATTEAASASDRSRFLQALTELTREQPKGALLSVRELRRRAELAKDAFDSVGLGLSREGLVTLHHHDFPTSLPESERAQLIVDERGTHYVGIALRSQP